ncbi:MAG: hypothetical protein ABIK19_01925 [candidate division WOR-3 bacterium]
MAIEELLLSLQLISQSPQSYIDLLDIKIWEDDTTKNKTVEKVDSTKTKAADESFQMSGKCVFGNYGTIEYGGDILLNVKNSFGEIGAMPYLDVNVNKKIEKAALGGILKFSSPYFNLNTNLEFDRAYCGKTDSLIEQRNLITPIQNGISWRDVYNRQISKEEQENVGKFFGLETAVNGKNNNVIIQLSNSSTTRNNKIITLDEFLENYRDSTQTIEGNFIIQTNTNLLTEILTNNETNVKIKDAVNQWRFFYDHIFATKAPIALGIGATLQNHIVETEIRNLTNILTDINGQTIVNIQGNNQTYVDTIPVTSHSEERRNTREFGREQINTDLLSLMFGITNQKNINNKFYADKAFFNSREWALKNHFNYQLGSLVNSLRAQLNNSSFGFGTTIAYDMLRLGWVRELTNYLNEKEMLERNVAMNDRQKEIIEKYNKLELLKKLCGYYASIDIDKVGGKGGYWKVNSEVGYCNYNDLRLRAGFGSERDNKEFYVGGGKKDVDLTISYDRDKIDKQDNWKLGATITFGF